MIEIKEDYPAFKIPFAFRNADAYTIGRTIYFRKKRTDLPDSLLTQAALVGRIIVEQGATSASKVDSGLERDFKAISLLKV